MNAVVKIIHQVVKVTNLEFPQKRKTDGIHGINVGITVTVSLVNTH